MTVIKHGTPKPLVEDMIAECEACKCVFTFGENEAKECSNNGGGYVWFTRCPECGSTSSYFDTGYPDNAEATRMVRETQAKLRLLVPAK